MSEEKEKYPFKITEHYSPGLNSLKRIYTQHPRFGGNERLIYELLFDYWNSDYGYAFPTVNQLAADSGLSESTVLRCLKTLIELRLIRKERSNVSQNNVYYVNKPVSTIEELIRLFPEVEAYREVRLAKLEEREARSMERLRSTKSEAKQPEEITEPAEETLVDWF